MDTDTITWQDILIMIDIGLIGDKDYDIEVNYEDT